MSENSFTFSCIHCSNKIMISEIFSGEMENCPYCYEEIQCPNINEKDGFDKIIDIVFNCEDCNNIIKSEKSSLDKPASCPYCQSNTIPPKIGYSSHNSNNKSVNIEQNQYSHNSNNKSVNIEQNQYQENSLFTKNQKNQTPMFGFKNINRKIGNTDKNQHNKYLSNNYISNYNHENKIDSIYNQINKNNNFNTSNTSKSYSNNDIETRPYNYSLQNTLRNPIQNYNNYPNNNNYFNTNNFGNRDNTVSYSDKNKSPKENKAFASIQTNFSENEIQSNQNQNTYNPNINIPIDSEQTDLPYNFDIKSNNKFNSNNTNNLNIENKNNKTVSHNPQMTNQDVEQYIFKNLSNLQTSNSNNNRSDNSSKKTNQDINKYNKEKLLQIIKQDNFIQKLENVILQTEKNKSKPNENSNYNQKRKLEYIKKLPPKKIQTTPLENNTTSDKNTTPLENNRTTNIQTTPRHQNKPGAKLIQFNKSNNSTLNNIKPLNNTNPNYDIFQDNKKLNMRNSNILQSSNQESNKSNLDKIIFTLIGLIFSLIIFWIMMYLKINNNNNNSFGKNQSQNKDNFLSINNYEKHNKKHEIYLPQTNLNNKVKNKNKEQNFKESKTNKTLISQLPNFTSPYKPIKNNHKQANNDLLHQQKKLATQNTTQTISDKTSTISNILPVETNTEKTSKKIKYPRAMEFQRSLNQKYKTSKIEHYQPIEKVAHTDSQKNEPIENTFNEKNLKKINLASLSPKKKKI